VCVGFSGFGVLLLFGVEIKPGVCVWGVLTSDGCSLGCICSWFLCSSMCKFDVRGSPMSVSQLLSFIQKAALFCLLCDSFFFVLIISQSLPFTHFLSGFDC
jgi:hypothetical protein